MHCGISKAGVECLVWQLGGRPRCATTKAYSWVGGDRPADVIDGIAAPCGIGFDTFKRTTEAMGVIENSRAVDAAVNTVAQIREAFGSEIEFGLDFHGRVSAPMAMLTTKNWNPIVRCLLKPVLAEQAEGARSKRIFHCRRRAYVLAF